MSGIVVIGAGQAGASLVAKLRAEGYAGPLTLLGEEAYPPYQRPPLSKKYLLGEMPRERLFLRPEAFYAEQGIDLRLGCRPEAIDRAARLVRIDGQALTYDQLVLATGARPRRLPQAIGGDLAGVFTLRGMADVDALAPHMRPGARLLVVGGGYIGLEAAAVARGLCLNVTLIEAAPRILQRVAAPETAEYFRKLHQAHGVDLCEGTGLERLLGEGAVTGADLSDGRRIDVDLVLAGIGVLPEVALAEAAGLRCDNGIAVDGQGRSSDPHIWAAGDCASFPWRGGRIRLESVGNAVDMGERVARNLMGAEETYQPEPWFWSDQYDIKLQIAGLNHGYEQVVARPGVRAGSLSHWYYAGGRLIALDAMNDPRAYMIGRRLLARGQSPDPAALARPETDLKALAEA
ncbi:NAD(P)/FAD-dependent oxidoreductase [Pseudooceanicola sp. 200-1SW]|uniref:NAD(P)/FAD-dependent oxidoreductase n=1 Tax=Pseudooceanicola sp. 200-1SW TaxID=3425949 RepID=UPI003D7FFC8F